MTRTTRPVEKMDHDEQELHEYLRRISRDVKEIVFNGEDTEEDEEDKVTDDRVTIIPPANNDQSEVWNLEEDPYSDWT